MKAGNGPLLRDYCNTCCCASAIGSTDAYPHSTRLSEHANIEEDTWRNAFAVQVSLIEFVNGEVLQYKAPTRFADTDQKLKSAATHFQNFADLSKQWLDNRSEETIDKASAEVDLAGTDLDAVKSEMEKVQP